MFNTKNQKKENIVLKTQNLSIGYQKNRKTSKIIASGINLSLKSGQFIALLGKNGVGKSTLLKTLCGIQKPIQGSVCIEKKELNTLTIPELAKTFSLVLTEKLPQSQLTVFELVALGRQPYTNWIGQLSENDVEKINNALHLTNIEHLKDKKIDELSDGQLQLTLISRALAQDTKIIILDEPTSHLDIHHKYQTFSLLKELVIKTQKTIIISTHEINLALQVAEEFILLSDKQITIGNKQNIIEQKAIHNLFDTKFVNFNTKLEIFTLKKL